MAAMKNHTVLLKKLKKQIKLLQRKEEKARNQLRTALKKIRNLGKTYKTKLAVKTRKMQGRIAETQALTYGKVAAAIERQMMKSVQAKSKALATAVARIEKKYVAKIKKSVKSKSKTPKSGKTAKVRQSTVSNRKKIKIRKRTVKRK